MKDTCKKGKKVPYLIEEKTAVFFESMTYTQHAHNLLKKGKVKGVYTCERAVRKALGAYPIGLPITAPVSTDCASIMFADNLVAGAWFLLHPSRTRDIAVWKTIGEYLHKACEALTNVYDLELDRFGTPKRRDFAKENNINKLALTQVELFRLRQVYKR
ncbi:hypothetical protein [Dyadobacter chenhuakuii]|uniref:Uncharacterized protein n=1 Tax=Dyadobacter chenhuakuii TaxID=2909339 RepID=A0ABY4XHT0_9BACT|nr:hypothetical protein [Dyadobacter chenhuakuii]MCF2495775.1 hypothetical protein [Dyadobacter chenhuakuii]USJ29806.1 hypothetical protein NFI80_18215 [Dyadobacter chenhuakuii]